MSEVAFRSVRRACYAGLDSVELRQEVARRSARVVPFDAYAFGTTDPDTGLLTHLVASEVPRPLVVTYCSHVYPYSTAVIGMNAAWERSPVRSMIARSPEYASAVREVGLRYELHVALTDGAELWGSWCLLREDGSEAAGTVERAFLERIAPHVTRGLKMATLIDRARGSTGEAPSTTSPTVLLLDAAGRPTLRTGGADAVLDDLADVGVQMPDGIPLGIADAAKRVRHHERTAAGRELPADAVLRVRGRSGRWYTVRMALAEPDAAGESAVVVVIEASRPREKAEILTRLYGLSAREREVVAAVVRGDSTKRIALQLGISPHTVKEHLDRAAAKIGVRGRNALVARLFFDGYAPRLGTAAPAS